MAEPRTSGTGAPAGSRRLSVTQADGTLVLTGVIDEAARLIDLLPPHGPATVRIDLAGITFINSLGVREWIRFLATAAATNVRLELARVSEPLIQQLNMIVAARGHADVLSFYAPYACDHCGREDSLLLELAIYRPHLLAGNPPGATCPECGSPMVFNDFPQRYFLFLAE